MASVSARPTCVRLFASAPVIGVRAPFLAATMPSSDTAAFSVTNGRCREMNVKNGRFRRSASSRMTPRTTSTPLLPEVAEAAPSHHRVRVLDRDHGTANPCFYDARSARSGPPGVRAGLERAVECRAASPIAGVRQRHHLGVRPARTLMGAAADHHALRVHDYGADHRIRAGAATATLGERQRPRHVPLVPRVPRLLVVHHFSSNSASTYSCGANGIRSSIPSPTPT